MSRDMSRDKSQSAHDIDVQPATIDVSDEDVAGKLEKTPSRSLPAVTLTGSGRQTHARPVEGGGGGGGADGVDTPGFVDVDDIAMQVDRDPNRLNDSIRVSTRAPATFQRPLLSVDVSVCLSVGNFDANYLGN